jgi:hypothetical protein
MRNRRFQIFFTRMALFAMLLLVFAPSVSRWIASNSEVSGSSWVEMCTVSGLKLVNIADFGKGETPTKTMPMGQDCAYCPLAASIASLLLLIALIFPLIAEHAVTVARQTLIRVFLYPSGLGSRGPPVLL